MRDFLIALYKTVLMMVLKLASFVAMGVSTFSEVMVYMTRLCADIFLYIVSRF